MDPMKARLLLEQAKPKQLQITFDTHIMRCRSLFLIASVFTTVTHVISLTEEKHTVLEMIVVRFSQRQTH